MLLIEYLRSIPTYTGSYGSSTGSALHHIQQFEFGERYVIRMNSGKSFDIPDLDAMLDIINSEFVLAEVMPFMSFSGVSTRSKSDPFGQRGTWDKMLVVSAKRPDNPPPWNGMQAFLDKIRTAVTIYNLSDSWDSFTKGNL